ncbi:hypothetical protein B0I35DRAFT_412108 [Stachybotrys elegans]|uniref:Uncharacterized protein n=1 Tax=Stachybotrys elegans TaxID=80388 RepID=A0A8K0SKZ0_9HYPO|nr:hypothetical protein B0I35DRAFT_412108 [Stachybotrys elegans]
MSHYVLADVVDLCDNTLMHKEILSGDILMSASILTLGEHGYPHLKRCLSRPRPGDGPREPWNGLDYWRMSMLEHRPLINEATWDGFGTPEESRREDVPAWAPT